MRITEPYTIFKRTLKSGRVLYYYQFRDEFGRRSNALSTGCSTLSGARRFCNKLYNSGQLKYTKEITFKDYASDFFEENSNFIKWKKVTNNEIKPNTLIAYKRHLFRSIIPYFSDYMLNRITSADVRNWVIWGSEQWSAQTMNNAQSVLKMILDHAVEEKIIIRNPVDNIPLRKVNRKVRELLTVEEIAKIYNSEYGLGVYKKIFLTACITGMRIGEILGLQKECVKDNYLDVKYSFVRNVGLGTTKTGRCRYVPIPVGLNIMEYTKNNSSWVFTFKETGKPINQNTYLGWFQTACKKAGINTKERNLTVHTLRNFFISYMEGKNVPHKKIQAVVGHADESMTDWYTYWKPDMFTEIYQEQQKLFDEITKE